MMANSLLFKLHRNRVDPKVSVDPKRFKEVFMSEYGKVRIYEVVGVSKKSKNWSANHTNKLCDAEGSWYCEGQYPPALAPVLKKRKSFAQLVRHVAVCLCVTVFFFSLYYVVLCCAVLWAVESVCLFVCLSACLRCLTTVLCYIRFSPLFF